MGLLILGRSICESVTGSAKVPPFSRFHRPSATNDTRTCCLEKGSGFVTMPKSWSGIFELPRTTVKRAVISTPAKTSPDPDRSLQLARAAARTAAENRGRDIVILDMRELTPVFDYFVLATGTSRRQMHAMSEEIDRVLEETMGDQRMNIEGYRESRWIVLDYGDVVVHLFDEETRNYYALEQLWSRAKRVELPERPDAPR